MQQQRGGNESSGGDDRTPQQAPHAQPPRLAPLASSASPSPLGVLSPTSGLAVSAGSDDGTILFVGDLSRGVKEEELEALFGRYGTLLAVDIKRDKLTHNNLGYGFVQLASRAEATRAKLALQGREVFGRKIRIGWAQKNTTLFVGDLDGTITTNQLIKAFEPFGHIIAEETFVKQPSGKYVRSNTEHTRDECHGGLCECALSLESHGFSMFVFFSALPRALFALALARMPSAPRVR